MCIRSPTAAASKISISAVWCSREHWTLLHLSCTFLACLQIVHPLLQEGRYGDGGTVDGDEEISTPTKFAAGSDPQPQTVQQLKVAGM